ICLTEGQIRFILAHGLNEEMTSKYPKLRFTSEKIMYEADRRSAEQRDSSHTSDKSCFIERFDTDQYRYNGHEMNAEGVRQRLREDGFIINKNVISMIFGQGKIPKSIAERYPHLGYNDAR
ncbi:MAG: hypothetical protein NC548_46045, partial [Lachnospiraceae bacterium]|nr:hypothetical protein [Lachnospiraceae bacterium]